LVNPVTVRTTVAPRRTWSSWPVMGEPPSSAGSVRETVAEALPPAAVPMVGEAGRVTGVTVFDGTEASVRQKLPAQDPSMVAARLVPANSANSGTTAVMATPAVTASSSPALSST
jgi:hypothetical protein